MKFGYTIVYVENVKESLAFFERAFGLKTSFLDEAAGYGELDTGATALAFASKKQKRARLKVREFRSMTVAS